MKFNERLTSLPAAGAVVFAFLAMVGLMGLLVLTTAPQADAQSPGTIQHPENSTDAVATFAVRDRGTPVTWDRLDSNDPVPAGTSIAAADFADGEHFAISEDGVLTFTAPPDFEAPRGAGEISPTNTNTYRVVVSASDGSRAGYHKVTVMVTNKAERGVVAWTTDANADGTPDDPELAQFQAGALLTAAVTDGDIAGVDKTVDAATWRWYRSRGKTATGTMIDGANSATYTATTADVGMHLRAMAYYLITGNVDQETASLTSGHPVLDVRAGSSRLRFDPATVSREVTEGGRSMRAGDPVTAIGNHGMVNYTLTGADAAGFEIDPKTGQITTSVDLDHEGNSAATATAPGSCADANPGMPDTECVVSITATDASGEGATIPATVTITIQNVDEKPIFSSGMTAIKSAENSAALAKTGSEADITYTAADPENLRINYYLVGPDGDRFQLDPSQILSFRTAPDHEMPADSDRDNIYMVTIRASDGVLHADRMVAVTVTNEDEPPAIMGRDSVSHPENGRAPVATLRATDPEGNAEITWSVAVSTTDFASIAGIETGEAADADHFDISREGILTFDIGGDDDTPDSSVPPDFEAPRGTGEIGPTNTNTYRVVVSASDGSQAGYHKVTVTVTSVAEPGVVAWTTDANADGSPDDPRLIHFQAGTLLTAAVTDGDIAGVDKTVTDPTWRWYRGGSLISDPGAQDNAYTATTADAGSRLRAVATYRVGKNTDQETASLTSETAVLAVRTGSNQLRFDPAILSREVTEGKKGAKAGAPVRATGNHGMVGYTLTGADADQFEIDPKTGQITTSVALDHEGKAASANQCDTANECSVTVTATDASGAATAASAADDPPVFLNATVTITPQNVDDKPAFDSGYETASIGEGTTVVDTNADGDTNPATGESVYAATDPEKLNVNLMLMGPDGARFSLSPGGVLSFNQKPDYENPADANMDNVYEVTMRASDGTLHEDRMVRVTVTDMDEGPEIIQGGLSISGPSSVDFDENGVDAAGAYTARGTNAATAGWSLEGADAGGFRLTGSGTARMLTFRTSPDHEMPADTGGDNTYMVTLRASDGTYMDTHDVTVKAADVDEMGSVTVTPMAASAGVELTASLDDPDEPTSNEAWAWLVSDALEGDYTGIGSENTAMYTPGDANTGRYLKAMATYTDGAFGAEEARSEPIRVLSSDTLSELSISDGTLSPPFEPGANSYTAMVDSGVASVNVTATASHTGASVSGDGMHELEVGANTITVTVTSEDGRTMDYTITIARAASSDATLSDLSISDGTMDPPFMADTTAYTATVESGVYSVNVAATAADMNAEVSGDGDHGLMAGDNTITVTVTAQDGSTVMDYTITVTRAMPTDPAERYDTNGTPGIQDDELVTAINDFLGLGSGSLDAAGLTEVINAFLGL